MLKFLEAFVLVAIVLYGLLKLIEMFSGWKFKKKKEATALSDLEEQAKKVAADKEDILGQTQKTKEVIDNINNTLNQ